MHARAVSNQLKSEGIPFSCEQRSILGAGGGGQPLAEDVRKRVVAAVESVGRSDAGWPPSTVTTGLQSLITHADCQA